MAAKLIAALVLCDVPAHALKAGQVLEAQPETIKGLAQSGDVDPHKDAAPAALARGAVKVRSAIELAEAEAAAERATAEAALTALEEQLAKAETEAAKNDLALQIVEQRAAIARMAQGAAQ